jgi:PAS domain S-box-containing protein
MATSRKRSTIGGRRRALTKAEANSINQRLFETSLDLIVVTDKKGTLIQISPSSLAILGCPPDELIGLDAGHLLHPGDLESTREQMRLARRGGQTRNFDCRDMTEPHRIEAQLRQAQKMEAVGQLTGGLAHDFNNILMIILANVEMIEEEHEPSDDLRERLADIGGAVQRASDLTRHLLAFSRRQPLRPQATNLNSLVAGMGKLLHRTLGEHVRIDQKLSPDLWTTSVDPTQFEAALLNLCVNARDAMPDGGRLLVETGNVVLDEEYAGHNDEVAAGRYAMLAVTDTGQGMPKAILDKVFEPFFTTKGVGKGSGLGLSMVYGFIKQSKGHIKIYSEPGRGTTIKIYLPRTAEAEEPMRPATEEPAPRGTEHVLLVEDDPAVRSSVLWQLRSLGYTVTEAPSGDEALALLAAGGFDAIVSDMVMPGRMSGLMVLEEAARRRPKVGTVLMSGYTENSVIQAGRLPDHVRLLIKPFTKLALARALRQAIDT